MTPRPLLVTAFCLASSIYAHGQTAPPPAQSSASPSSGTQQIPSGTILHIRLQQTVSSFGSKAETPVTAVLIAPVELNGHIVLPLNTELHGTIVQVRRVGLGFVSETALLNLQFDSLTLPDGQALQLKGQVSAVDDSRETVDKEGRIHGIRATASASKMLSGFAISAASLDPLSLMFGLSASLSAFRIPEAEILMPAGTELRFRTLDFLAVSAQFPGPPPVVQPGSGREQLNELIHPLPYRTATDKTNMPSDLTSLLYIGSQDSILRAFDAAGWDRSDPLGAQSSYGVMRSVIENQGYKEAPVSTLLLDGKPPVATFAKTLDTFFSRHHTRIYAASGTYDNQPIFVSTGTHDSGIGISKSSKTMIHVIDENIDEERNKIVYDLLLTGCVDGVEYVDRPWLPEDAKNATGDTLRTDRRMAVLRMNACESPHRADTPGGSTKKVKEKGNEFERISRDAVLYTRDDVFRGNIAYQGYSGIKMVIGMRKKPKPDEQEEPGKPKTVTVVGEQFQIVSRPNQSMPKGLPKDPANMAPSFHLPGEPRSYVTHLSYSISAGYSRFGNHDFSTQDMTMTGDIDDVPILYTAHYIDQLHTGYSIAAKATLDSWKYVSNEFGYTYNDAALTISGPQTATITLPGLGTSSSTTQAYNYFTGQVRQFSYNALFHARPNGKRFRPFLAVGPAFQLLRLSDSVPTKNTLLKFTIKDAGIVFDAYNFGSKPPLEGGGIFQFGLQYGAGFKYQVTPRFFVRSDFRETLSPQPDYWSKSYGHGATILPPFLITFGNQERFGPLRQQAFTTGFGISF